MFSKIFETILSRSIVKQVGTRLDDAQHGFRAARSTATNQVQLVDYVAAQMDLGFQVDTAFFDFRKAFDLVDNDVLLQKLSEFGFVRNLLKFFADYLGDRRQYVQLMSYESEEFFTRSGVSQGSTLGPLLFLLMINDLPRVLSSSKCLMFADDLKLFFPISTANDCDVLQDDITAVARWSENNKLLFNPSKCQVMTFTRSTQPVTSVYTLNGTNLSRVDSIRDLGVVLDSKLDFHDHIIDTCKSASRTMGFIMRVASQFKNPNIIVMLYNAYVRSKLEFNSVVWDPKEIKYTTLLERVQRKFCRFLYRRRYGYYPLLYPSKFVLGMVGYDTLEHRRKRNLLILYCKILNNEIDIATVLESVRFFVPQNYMRIGVRRRLNLFVLPDGIRTRHALNSPTPRALSLLNNLLQEIQDTDVFCDKWSILIKKIDIFLNAYLI